MPASRLEAPRTSASCPCPAQPPLSCRKKAGQERGFAAHGEEVELAVAELGDRCPGQEGVYDRPVDAWVAQRLDDLPGLPADDLGVELFCRRLLEPPGQEHTAGRDQRRQEEAYLRIQSLVERASEERDHHSAEAQGCPAQRLQVARAGFGFELGVRGHEGVGADVAERDAQRREEQEEGHEGGVGQIAADDAHADEPNNADRAGQEDVRAAVEAEHREAVAHEAVWNSALLRCVGAAGSKKAEHLQTIL